MSEQSQLRASLSSMSPPAPLARPARVDSPYGPCERAPNASPAQTPHRAKPAGAANCASKAWGVEHDTLNMDMIFNTPPLSAAALREALQKLQGFDVNARSELGETLLATAVATGAVEVLQVLKDFGAIVNLRSPQQGASMLHEASSPQAVAWLVAQGVHVHARDNEGNTPLHTQAYKGSPLTVRALLALGAKVNAKNNRGRTSLHSLMSMHSYGSYDLRADALTALLAAGASVNAKDSQGQTALHYAAKNDMPLTVCALALAGADLELVDNRGSRPIDLASQCDVGGSIFALNALGASMRHVNSVRPRINDFFNECRLLSAARSASPEIMKAHLGLFSRPSDQAIEAAMTLLKRNDPQGLQAMLAAHMAAQAIEDMLEGARQTHARKAKA